MLNKHFFAIFFGLNLSLFCPSAPQKIYFHSNQFASIEQECLFYKTKLDSLCTHLNTKFMPPHIFHLDYMVNEIPSHINIHHLTFQELYYLLIVLMFNLVGYNPEICVISDLMLEEIWRDMQYFITWHKHKLYKTPVHNTFHAYLSHLIEETSLLALCQQKDQENRIPSPISPPLACKTADSPQKSTPLQRSLNRKTLNSLSLSNNLSNLKITLPPHDYLIEGGI